MKKAILLWITLTCSIIIIAQAPRSFRYQTVVRNSAGELLADKSVGIKISILQNSPTGMIVFSETFSLITNSVGLINLSVGKGLVLSGSLDGIDWGNGEYFMRIDVDSEGGNNYEFMGTSQLLSVPYALYAETAGDGIWKKNGNDVYYDEGKVGIGLPAPVHKLSIEGSEDEWPGRIFASIRNTSESGKSLAYLKIFAGPGETGTSLGHISTTYTANERPEEVAGFGMLSSSGNGMIINATKPDLSAGVIKFFNGQLPGTRFIETMRINENGFVGIGTVSPVAKLEVADGDIYIKDINRGIIMTSPDGQCWRGTIGNDGVLHFVMLPCP